MAQASLPNPSRKRRGTPVYPKGYRPLPENYVLEWTHEGLETLRNKVDADFKFRIKVKNLKIIALRWPLAYADPHNILDHCIEHLPYLEHLEVVWEDGDQKSMVAKDPSTQKTVSMRVLQIVVAALKYKAEQYHTNPQEYARVKSVSLDGVYWGLFTTNGDRFAKFVSPYLQHLTLRFAPVSTLARDPQAMTSVGYLGRILQSALQLQTLNLQFASVSKPLGVIYQSEVRLPPVFQNLVTNTVFPDLKELTLDNVVLGSDFATRFFGAHAKTLKVVELTSLWNSISITTKEAPVTQILTDMGLRDLQFRGCWVNYQPVGDGPNDRRFCIAQVVLDTNKPEDLQEMEKREKSILPKGHDSRRSSPTPWRPPQNLWQKFCSFLKDLKCSGQNKFTRRKESQPNSSRDPTPNAPPSRGRST